VLYKFKPSDLLHNRIKTHPHTEFFIYDRKVYYNKKPELKGQFTSSTYPTIGHVNINEINVDRTQQQLIYPFITKEGSLTSFSTVSTSQFNNDFVYGDVVTGSYPLEATITRTRYAIGQSRPHIQALQNTLNYYAPISRHYEYSGIYGNKSTQELSLIDIPSIFYGTKIKKGTIDCKFYVSGTLVGQLQDINENGELIQTGPPGSNGSGSVAGVALYNEGFLVITGSWSLDDGHTEPYIPGELATTPKWLYFASTGGPGIDENLASSSFDLSFDGTTYVSTITMFAHANQGELNHSNNPSYLKFGQEEKRTPITGSKAYKENTKVEIKNIVQSPYNDPTASFSKQTYISKVGIYDEHKNLIAIAKLAKPLRKRIEDQYTIKLALDI
jgi:hypothetical protein